MRIIKKTSFTPIQTQPGDRIRIEYIQDLFDWCGNVVGTRKSELEVYVVHGNHIFIDLKTLEVDNGLAIVLEGLDDSASREDY